MSRTIVLSLLVVLGLTTEDLAEREDELLAFAVCMRENGYEMPDPDFSSGGHTGWAIW